MNGGIFPDELKRANTKPLNKKESRNEKENYRPVNIYQTWGRGFICSFDWLLEGVLLFATWPINCKVTCFVVLKKSLWNCYSPTLKMQNKETKILSK